MIRTFGRLGRGLSRAVFSRCTPVGARHPWLVGKLTIDNPLTNFAGGSVDNRAPSVDNPLTGSALRPAPSGRGAASRQPWAPVPHSHRNAEKSQRLERRVTRHRGWWAGAR